MMNESQTIEWKNAWRDEYIKWICGFANANGGRLEIGKDDHGKVTGIANAQKLLEDLPNKVRDLLGILVDVNLHSDDGKNWISIEVSPYPFPISYKGQFHYRSGSTKQELTGASLNRFLLRKHGKRWDSVPVPYASSKDLAHAALEYFKKKAIRSKRLPEDILEESDDGLIDKLHLKEKEFLKRAAILLFHADPEKYVTGAYIKIGFFQTEDDLQFQDDIHGHLFEQVEKTMELLLSKYLKASIRYEGINRIEDYPYPEAALRETLLNAVTHKDYSSGNPIQIRVYEDRIVFWNAGQLPENWTMADLAREHPSQPYNPDIANAFFWAGLVEAWGRGTLKIIKECQLAEMPAPVFEYAFSGFKIEFKAAVQKTSEKMSEKMSGKTSEKILALLKEDENLTISTLAERLEVTERTIERNLQKLQKKKLLVRVGSDKGGYWKVV